MLSLAAGTAALLSGLALHPPARAAAPSAAARATALRMAVEPANVAQTQDTSRDKVMTFSYDMSLEPKYEKPTYPGTGNGLGGEEGEYDVVVIGSGMGGLACGALTAKYGDSVCVLESHIKVGGSAHTFSRMHKGGKYSFEVGPSIFEGLDKPSYNPLRIVFDILGALLTDWPPLSRSAAPGTRRARGLTLESPPCLIFRRGNACRHLHWPWILDAPRILALSHW